MRLQELTNAQALRSIVKLEPVEGPGGRVFPPTFPAEEGTKGRQKFRHAVEEVGDGRKRVLIDSVASQANRQEAALVEARKAGLIDFSDVYVDLSDTNAGIDVLSATEMPHRLSDAILRDSEIDGVPFAKSAVGQRILSATRHDLSPLLELSPTSVVYGCWFSGFKIAQPLKQQRCVVSEIWAENAILGKAAGSRIDPLGMKRKVTFYETEDGGWTALEEEAVKSGSKPKKFGKEGKPSEAKHGNIAPDLREQGITAESYTLRWALPLAAVRRLRFGDAERDKAGQAYIVALGLAGRMLDHNAGYSLRSRCDFVTHGPLTLDIINREGEVASPPVTQKEVLAILGEAEEGMRRAGLAIHQRVEAKPGKRLVAAIAINSQLIELEDEGGSE
jgi:CRISPR-associated protein Csb1